MYSLPKPWILPRRAHCGLKGEAVRGPETRPPHARLPVNQGFWRQPQQILTVTPLPEQDPAEAIAHGAFRSMFSTNPSSSALAQKRGSVNRPFLPMKVRTPLASRWHEAVVTRNTDSDINAVGPGTKAL